MMSDPRVALISGVGMLIIGCLMFRYRAEIGGATGYSYGGIPVDRPTPGCMVATFGVVLVLAGIAFIVVSLLEILGS